MSSKIDVLAVATQAVETAVRLGAKGADAYVRAARNLAIDVRNGEIESVKQANTFGLGIRVEFDGRTALVHTTSVSGLSLIRLVGQAIDMTKAMPESKEPAFFAADAPAPEMPHPDPELMHEPHEAKVARLAAAERALLGVPGVTGCAGVGCKESDGETALVSSAGARRYTPTCLIETAAEAVAETANDAASGSRYAAACARTALLDPETLGREAGQNAARLLGARPVPSTRVPVIFTPQVGYAVLVYLQPPTAGDNVMRERSYLRGRLGERLAPESVSIIDDPLLPTGPGRRPFDGEGTPCRRLPIIEQGVLRNYLTDIASAQALGVAPGGNTARDSYTEQPRIGASTIYMQAGDLAPEEIVRRTQRGLLLASLSGWWVGLSPVTDTFSSAAMGFWIENGEIVHPVKGISIGSTLCEMLAGIDLIGSDLRFLANTSTPTFRVAEMAVSGT